MSWLFSRALVAEYSGESCSGGEPSALLNVMPTPHRFSRHDKTMDHSQLSRFGLTCAVLTEDHGTALLTSYLADFRARTSQMPAMAQELLGGGSGLWVEMARIIHEVRPQYAFLENSPAITSRGMDIVLGDLAEMGFDAQWGVFSACAQGAPHTRERMFVVANSRCDRSQAGKRIEGTPLGEWSRGGRSAEQVPIRGNSGRHSWWDTEPGVDRVADGMANKLDRVKSIGNGQVPLVAAAAWRILTHSLAQADAACGVTPGAMGSAAIYGG